MSTFSASEVFNVSAHGRIVSRVVTDLPALTTEALGSRRVEGIGVWSFLTMVALLVTIGLGVASLVAPTPWGVAALSIEWDKNEEAMFVLGSDPSELKISSLAEADKPGSSLLSRKIEQKAGSLEGSVVADWFESINAPSAAATIRNEVADEERNRLVTALVAGLMVLLTPFIASQIAIRVCDPPVDMGPDDLAAPIVLWAGFWGVVELPFGVATLLFPTSPLLASFLPIVWIAILAAEAWQLHAILKGSVESEPKESLIVYLFTALTVWLVGVAGTLAIMSFL